MTFQILLLALLPAFSVSALAEPQHNHTQDSEMQPALTLNQGEKWPTDAPLRESMAKLRHALIAVLEDIHHDRLTEQGYKELANTVQQQSGYIIRHCALTPEADAQFHIILAQLMTSAQIMQQTEHQRRGGVKLLQALKDYNRYFADEDFAPIVH